MNIYAIDKQPPQIAAELAVRHKQLRKQLKLTQADLAQRSGVSLGSIKRFERTGKVSLDNLLKTSRILGRLNEFESLLLVNEDLAEIEKLFSDEARGL